MGSFRNNILRLLFAAFYLLSMMTLGFAHTGLATVRSIEATALTAEYQLPDGSFPDICLGESDNEHKRLAAYPICDACLLVSASALVAFAPEVEALDRVFKSVHRPFTGDATPVMRVQLLQQPRAPPFQI
ncbi:MAG: hypothetical protein RLZZ444_439 [Pseudomonadota bacterium]|jgi:hypothetical protein